MRKLRLLLFPFAGVYYVITLLRNKLYDVGFLNFRSYQVPIICIGNLNVGGTGKSPATEYMIRLLKDQYKVATLSRGYGRETKGYREVLANDKASNVGDEPLQFAQKFPDVKVAVCEDRQTGIDNLLHRKPELEVIVLDDAYQHRKVCAGLNILLTAYGDLYSEDFLLPAGNLREPRVGANRADVIVVTKCPNVLANEEKLRISDSLNLNPNQTLFFSKIAYDDQVYSNKSASQLNSLKTKEVFLVTGIANPNPLLKYLDNQGLSYNHKIYGDHHNFNKKEIDELNQLPCILTTEKDYVRLRPLLSMQNLYYLPIEMNFLENANQFDDLVFSFLKRGV